MTDLTGAQAHAAGEPISACPYLPADPAGAGWRASWIQAESASRHAAGTFGVSAEQYESMGMKPIERRPFKLTQAQIDTLSAGAFTSFTNGIIGVSAQAAAAQVDVAHIREIMDASARAYRASIKIAPDPEQERIGRIAAACADATGTTPPDHPLLAPQERPGWRTPPIHHSFMPVAKCPRTLSFPTA